MNSIKAFFGLLFVLASIVYANIAFNPQPEGHKPSSASDGVQVQLGQPRCPEDSVRLLTNYPNDKGYCEAVDDLEGQLRVVAEETAASCPEVGQGVVSIEGDETVTWCNGGGTT